MSIDIGDLRTEIVLDPTGNGYATMENFQVVDKLNEFDPAKTVVHRFVENWQLASQVDAQELRQLHTQHPDRFAMWQMLLTPQLIEIGNSLVQDQVREVWQANTTTRAQIIALATRSGGSRAEELWFADARVGLQHVREARS